MKRPKSLTSRQYWEAYYQKPDPVKAEIVKVCSSYDWLFEKLMQVVGDEARSIFEIGCYPGRFLAYCAAKYGLSAHGIDFNSDTAMFEKTMQAMGVEHYEYIQADFLDFTPAQKYDVLMSNGVIEHFDNYDHALDLHIGYVSERGAMLIMIPNMTYGQFLYRFCFDRNNLLVHNTRCMSLKVFREFARRNDLNIEYLSYFGGFLTNPHRPLTLFERILHKPIRIAAKMLNPLFAKYPTRFWSSSMVGMFSFRVNKE